MGHGAIGLFRSRSGQCHGKIEYAVDKVERQLGETAWLAGDVYTLADINFMPIAA
jgi:glutathione S-transferase